jgi:hypothetical protein
MRRYVMRPLAGLTDLLTPAEDERTLLEFSCPTVFADLDEVAHVPASALDREVRRLRPEAGALYWRVTPRRGGWRLRKAGLAVCRGDLTELWPEVTVTSHPATLRPLFSVGQRVFSYPVNILKGSPSRAAKVFERFTGRRQLALYGKLRGRSKMTSGDLEISDATQDAG